MTQVSHMEQNAFSLWLDKIKLITTTTTTLFFKIAINLAREKKKKKVDLVNKRHCESSTTITL